MFKLNSLHHAYCLIYKAIIPLKFVATVCVRHNIAIRRPKNYAITTLSLSSTLLCISPFLARTLLPHSCLLALAQPALLALSAHVHVHFTLATIFADILGTLDDAAAEKALATLATQNIVVEA